LKNFNFQNPRWETAAILKTVIAPYLRNRLTDFDKIWQLRQLSVNFIQQNWQLKIIYFFNYYNVFVLMNLHSPSKLNTK